MLRRALIALAALALAWAACAATPDWVAPDGGRYYGPLVEGRLHGRGRIEYPNGTVYEGEFSRGKFHGAGRYTDARGTVYEGSFVEGSLEGRGRVSGNGAVYEGELKQWQFHGRGVLRQRNGEVFEGRFENGVYLEEHRRILADTEAALYAQKSLLDRALAALQPGEPGRIDLYLLAVGGDGSQEVFRREVEFVEKAFAGRFGTAGRSVALINSRNTLTSAPMATLSSIGAALQAIGERMNRDEDILFLFLTSHGSREHELMLGQRALQLRGLGAAQLAAQLGQSGIRWKVVVVSACYSGGFIDALKDERTLVITAARRDRASFGCADENDFTYFGRAFFKEALPGSSSFSEAFLKAKVLVEQWERKDAAQAAKPGDKGGARSAEENRSLPQISSTAPIDAHLARWWAQLPSRSR